MFNLSLAGCTTTGRVSNNSASTALIDHFLAEPLGPFFSYTMMTSGAIDLLYCSASFFSKNDRWPRDYEELAAFVKQSDGYLWLQKYEKVEVTALKDDSVRICYIRPGRTNELNITLGPPRHRNK